MRKNFSLTSTLQVSLLLFGFFFGAGNLIFPPLMGKMAGTEFLPAISGFAITAVLCPVLGIFSVAKMDGMDNLAKQVDKYFGLLFPLVICLAIGPGLGIPRAGSVPFVMALEPLLPPEVSLPAARALYTVVFFAIAFWLCISPGKIVRRVGKFITPLLLLLICSLFFSTWLKFPFRQGLAQGPYAGASFLTGVLEGYNTMDALAALNFGFAITIAIKSLNLKDGRQNGRFYTYAAAVIAGTFLLIVYGMLTYIGVTTADLFPTTKNGAEILRSAAAISLGKFGYALMLSVFSLACLTTCIGLIVSLSDYFSKICPYFTYKKMVTIICVISCLLANFGLDAILKFSLPTLFIMSPVSVVLILLGIGERFYRGRRIVFSLTVYVCLLFSFIDVFNKASWIPTLLRDFMDLLPLSEFKLAWLVPTLLGFGLSFIGDKLYLCSRCRTAGALDVSEKMKTE